MKIILYCWGSNSETGLYQSLINQGHEVWRVEKKCSNYLRDLDLAELLFTQIHRHGAEMVFSLNYFPIVTMVCKAAGISYISWVYDSPHFTLYAHQVREACNHIFAFDRDMVEYLRSRGVNTVRYMPLATDSDLFVGILERADEAERKRYQCDISFVGSMYRNSHNYFDMLLAEEEKKELEPAIARQMFCYDRNTLGEDISDEVLVHIGESTGVGLGKDFFATSRDVVMTAVLEKKVTVKERESLLEQISRQFSLDLYTDTETPEMPLVNNCGLADPLGQTPLIFAGSRINLNITLRSIHSGIPLRALDVMACGGFLLSNYQKELGEYFVEGKEMEMFRTQEECLQKISYYLTHEEERKAIAVRGQKKVREDFSYKKKFSEILKNLESFSSEYVR